MAEREVLQAETRRQNGDAVTASKTKATDYLEEWLDVYQRHEVSKVTFHDNTRLIKKYVIASVGQKALSSITAMDCQRLINAIAKAGKTRTAVQVFNLMKKSFRKATEMGYLIKNPMDLVTKPRDRAQERPSLTILEASRFLTFAKESPMYALLAFLLLTGVRPEEAMGLQWKDLDWNKQTVSIRRALKRLPNGEGWEFSDLKTVTSRRNIDLGETLTAILRKHKEEQDDAKMIFHQTWNDHQLIFTNQVGNPVDISRARKHLAKILEKANLPKIRLYDLRHTHGSMLLEQDVNIKAISERLGHANTSMTLNRYLHTHRSQSSEGVLRLDRALHAANEAPETDL
ncbi:tyrosine-type recombinase/integrase [Ferroacidibacillus organovorans]|uniref:Tyr recombinase domain-containing protein n=1 Tax=Ferroacidibacillus organovorans TaxID=1765683 RepID=A0A1V4EST1_9BACL|nr:site-specific integrase [Ferroacidibacillus organovorans]OPG16005.1 hypothetical protein B2M26_08845 [Ferroacidibacillus organovorans]